MSIVLTSIDTTYPEVESAIRNLTQLYDLDVIPSELVLNSFELAEREVAPHLKAENISSADASLQDGKYMLAASFLLRSLATNQGVNLRIQRLGNVQENNNDKPQNLVELANEWYEQAWGRLARFCQETPTDIGATLLVQNESCD